MTIRRPERRHIFKGIMEDENLSRDSWSDPNEDAPAGDHYMLYWQERSIIDHS